ncbi:MAG: tripartite tricarboxylate transporter substrate binding protein [Betaproteobacteria bacterium]|nr:tripartite tricarboxylate transporter substrate binding protein [Betaproteobacteria bacterium]
MHKLTRFTAVSAALLAAVLTADNALAQRSADKYPVKPIRLIVPFAPGGGTDIVARALAQKLTDALGQSVIVDNRAGAAGTIGTETTVRATPDGYTLIMVSASYSTNAALFKLPYDPINDISPIALIGESGFMVALHPSVPAKTIKELIALAKARPDSLNFASTGTGGITHLATELFNLMADTKMTHVPYKGTGAALSDLLGGQVQLIFGSMPTMVPQNKMGRLRGIAVTTARRNNAVPDLPTVAETVPGYEAILWYACWGPKYLPKEIITRWNTEIANAINSPAMKERMAGEGLDPAGGPPAQLLDVLKRDVPKWAKVVKAANVKVIQ